MLVPQMAPQGYRQKRHISQCLPFCVLNMFDSSVKAVDVALSDSISLSTLYFFSLNLKKTSLTFYLAPWIFLVPPIHFEMYLRLVLQTSFLDYALVIHYFLV